MQDFKMDLDRSVPAADLKRSVMEAVQEYSDNNVLSAKDGRHLCLAAEETMEMLSLLKDRRPGKLCIVPDENGVVLWLTTDSYPGGDHLSEQVDFEKASLDMRYNTPSMKKYTDVPIINTEAINSYRNIVHSDWSFGNKYYMSPAEAQTFEGLCDTYVETTEFDPLHDEGVEYAKKLKAAGVNVILNETKGTVHSFDMADNSSIVEAAVESRVEFLNKLFHD